MNNLFDNELRRKYTLKGRIMSCQLFIDELHQEFHQNYTLDNGSNNIATKINIPSLYGKGTYNYRPIHDFIVAEENGLFFDDVSVHGQAQESCGFIIVLMKGGTSYCLNKTKKMYDVKKQYIYLGFMQEYQEMKRLIKKDLFTSSFTFVFSKKILLEYLEEFENVELSSKLQKANTFEIFNAIPITAKHNHIISNIFSNPYKGILKNIYFENHVTQLLMNILEDLNKQKKVNIFLDDYDKNRLHKAKKLLLEDLQNPPTIRELSHLVALNEDKLKKGFKLIFDTTIFKTLTDQRMRQALQQVQIGDMNVGEIAFEAGYENVSSFIATFKKTYGQTPGVLQKEAREKKNTFIL